MGQLVGQDLPAGGGLGLPRAGSEAEQLADGEGPQRSQAAGFELHLKSGDTLALLGHPGIQNLVDRVSSNETTTQ